MATPFSDRSARVPLTPPAPAATLESAVISVGTILHDTYRIEDELGRGGMGCVFAATHTRLPRRVAVKVLMQTTDAQALKRFRREAEICAQIGHHNIAEVFDFNEVNGQPYIV